MTGPVFVKRPPWRLWCDLVAREAKGQGTVADGQLVRDPDSLLPWLRALNQISLDIDAQIADGRLRLKATAPLPGEQPTREYLLEKAEHDRRLAGRLRVKRSVESRLDECRHLVETAGLDPLLTVGALVTAMARLEELLLRDDVDGALGLVRSVLDRVGTVEAVPA